MKKITFAIIAICIIATSCNNAPKFDHYGVYIDTSDGYVELNPDSQDFPHIKTDSSITIVVYDPSAKQHTYRLIQGIDEDGDRLRSSYETTTVKTPFKDNDEQLKFTAPVFGGPMAFVDEDTEYEYYFFAENPTIKQSLMKWMADNIRAYEEKDFVRLLPFVYTKRELSRLPDGEKQFYAEQLASSDRLQRNIDELEEILESLESGKEQIEFLPREYKDCIGVWDYVVMYEDGYWEID